MQDGCGEKKRGPVDRQFVAAAAETGGGYDEKVDDQ